MQNVGKVFERQFKASVPDYCLLQRLADPPQSFEKSNLYRFSLKNPCDFFMFDSQKHILYCLELKTTKSKSISFEKIDVDKQANKMIHKHQILALMNFQKYENVTAGFFFNFRDEIHDMERTYFQNIDMFMKMYNEINKSSFNEMDLILYGAVKIEGTKKRVNYIWNIEKFLKSQ